MTARVRQAARKRATARENLLIELQWANAHLDDYTTDARERSEWLPRCRRLLRANEHAAALAGMNAVPVIGRRGSRANLESLRVGRAVYAAVLAATGRKGARR